MTNESKKIAILMGIYNGEKFVAQQLESFKKQTHPNWELYVSDDGSNDATISIISSTTQSWDSHKVEVLKGPQSGFSKNFLSLACNAQIKADYYAFADQDDVWLENKLEMALKTLIAIEKPGIPALYFGRTIYTDEKLKPYGYSKLMNRPLSFKNAIIQSVAGGNTMLFNSHAKKLLERIGPVPAVSHDWWLYQVITGVNGIVVYDKTPYVLYRQHDNALIGGNTSLASKLKRVINGFNNRFKSWSDQNIQCFALAAPFLKEEHNATVRKLNVLRTGNLWQRAGLTLKTGIYRQSRIGTLAINIAALFKKV